MKTPSFPLPWNFSFILKGQLPSYFQTLDDRVLISDYLCVQLKPLMTFCWFLQTGSLHPEFCHRLQGCCFCWFWRSSAKCCYSWWCLWVCFGIWKDVANSLTCQADQWFGSCVPPRIVSWFFICICLSWGWVRVQWRSTCLLSVCLWRERYLWRTYSSS